MLEAVECNLHYALLGREDIKTMAWRDRAFELCQQLSLKTSQNCNFPTLSRPAKNYNKENNLG